MNEGSSHGHDSYQVLDCCFGLHVDLFKDLQVVVRESVDDRNTDIRVIVVLKHEYVRYGKVSNWVNT